jgi:hypothetical protein
MADEDFGVEGSVKTSTMRRWLIFAILVLVAFLAGLLPMAWKYMNTSSELRNANAKVARTQLENTLASAALYARRGEYETARQNASKFFTDVKTVIDSSSTDVLSTGEKIVVEGLLIGRDDIITLLSRGDPASADRLSEFYVRYKAAASVTVETP